MEDGQSVVADSGSEIQAAPSEAAGPTDPTHGEPTEHVADTPPEADAEGTTPDESGDESDAEFEEKIKDLPEEEQKTRSERRRENRIKREQERIEQAVADRLAAIERERTEAAEATKRKEAAKKAREAAAKEFAVYVGEDGEADRLNAEIADFTRKIRAEVADPQGVDTDELEAEIARREGRLSEIQKGQKHHDAVAQNIWNGIEAHIYSPLSWPELADQATKQRYLQAPGGIAGALSTLKEIVVASVEARKDAEIAEITKAHAAKVATLEDAVREWRVRAGGAEVVDTTSGGSAVAISGVLTPERYAGMTTEERQKLRATSDGRRQIDEMSRRRTGFGQRSA